MEAKEHYRTPLGFVAAAWLVYQAVENPMIGLVAALAAISLAFALARRWA